MEIPLANKTDVENAVAAARSAFDWGPWPKMSGVERSVYLRRLSEEIKQRMPLFPRLMTAEAGAPVAFVNRLIQDSPRRFGYFAELAGTYVFEERRPTPRGHARVHREPIGVAALWCS
jgi:aldehyde dehydrogenase (NAD+)